MKNKFLRAQLWTWDTFSCARPIFTNGLGWEQFRPPRELGGVGPLIILRRLTLWPEGPRVGPKSAAMGFPLVPSGPKRGGVLGGEGVNLGPWGVRGSPQGSLGGFPEGQGRPRGGPVEARRGGQGAPVGGHGPWEAQPTQPPTPGDPPTHPTHPTTHHPPSTSSRTPPPKLLGPCLPCWGIA